MVDGKKLYSFVEVDDSTPIQKLKISFSLKVKLVMPYGMKQDST